MGSATERFEIRQIGTVRYRQCQYEDVLGRPDSHYTRGTRVYACEHKTAVIDIVASGDTPEEARGKLGDLVNGLSGSPDTLSFDTGKMRYCLHTEGAKQPICGDWFSHPDEAYNSLMRRQGKGLTSPPPGSKEADKRSGGESKNGGTEKPPVSGTTKPAMGLDLPGTPHTLPNGQVVWR